MMLVGGGEANPESRSLSRASCASTLSFLSHFAMGLGQSSLHSCSLRRACLFGLASLQGRALSFPPLRRALKSLSRLRWDCARCMRLRVTYFKNNGTTLLGTRGQRPSPAHFDPKKPLGRAPSPPPSRPQSSQHSRPWPEKSSTFHLKHLTFHPYFEPRSIDPRLSWRDCLRPVTGASVSSQLSVSCQETRSEVSGSEDDLQIQTVSLDRFVDR
jgi:hypothetical protein